MEITKRTARRAVLAGTAESLGTTVSDGYRWEIINRLDLQRVDHVRLERASDDEVISRIVRANVY